MKYYVVDAFTDELFKGNQAGVCLVEEPLGADLMQSIAAENNLSETAFVERRDGYYDLRWFTPTVEVDLCGHATLASAFIIFNFVEKDAESVEFHTLSGVLTVRRVGELLEMDFPSRKPVPIPITPLMERAIGVPVLEAGLSRDMLLRVGSEQQVRDLKPDFRLISELPDCMALIVTAQGEGAEGGEGFGKRESIIEGESSKRRESVETVKSADFVSRFFAPSCGIDEDPVTGSSHSTLIPYWAEKLGKDRLVARQLSRRGGTLYCAHCSDRVKIAGAAALYLEGEIKV